MYYVGVVVKFLLVDGCFVGFGEGVVCLGDFCWFSGGLICYGNVDCLCLEGGDS